jgi:alcohol dehydrogenase (cytochrome c)
MAFAENRLFVPWLDLPTRTSATRLSGGLAGGLGSLERGRGGVTALDAETGRVLWQRKLPQIVFGAATVANDVVFTSTYDGTIYGLDTATGRTLWRVKARAGVNSFPAIDGDTLLVGAAAPGFFKKPQFQLIAYSLS